jgi:hypothetical protein
MAGRLRKMAHGVYEISGSLDGLAARGRVVEMLTVRRLGPDSAEGLRPLVGFRELRRLHLERITGVDLSPLAELDLEILDIQQAEQLDLAPLAMLEGLWLLQLISLRGCRAPKRLTLPASVRSLSLGFDAPKFPGEELEALIEAIDWPRLADLQELYLDGSDSGGPAAEVDLGFLRHLRRLERLRIELGVWHRGPEPSPLEPPFAGLPTTLRHISLDAWKPEPLKAALQEHLPAASVVVLQRYGVDDGEPWEILPPGDGDDEWCAYGSLWDAMGAGDDETEYDALQAARKRIRAADPDLLPRLDFDHESDGTGISARAREDLERALGILGLPPD